MNIAENSSAAVRKERFSFKKAFVIFRMLLQDKTKISFKGNLKKAILKILSLVFLFAILAVISRVFYFLVVVFNIFSVLPYVPVAVPSLIMSFLLIFEFFALLSGLSRSLFTSPDNQILLTYPCSGSTVFFARILVYYVYELGRFLVVQIPLLFGFMMTMNSPIGMYFFAFPSLAFICLFLVMLAAALSIPYYLWTSFLRRHNWLRLPLITILALAFCAIFVYIILMVPDTVDIFTNWGYYFRIIQNLISGYKRYCAPFLYLTNFAIGDLNGFSYTAFPTESLYTFLILLGAIVLLGLFVFFVVNPYYLHLSSMQGQEKDSRVKRRKNRKHHPFLSQMKKELLLLKGGGSKGLSNYLLAFLILPFLCLVLAKFFSGMDLSPAGRVYVETMMLLAILLIVLASTSALSHSFSDEEDAYLLTRSYPRNNKLFILSKLIVPGGLGLLSTLATVVGYGYVYEMDLKRGILLFLIVSLAFLTCSLAALFFDFVHLRSNFLKDGSKSKSERNTTILAFVLAIVLTVLFFLFRKEETYASYVKLAIVVSIFFIVSLAIFLLKAKYEGKEERVR